MNQKTMILTVQELVQKMRNMKVDEEVCLAMTANANPSYKIHRLPDGILNNGMCWLAGYYGGGSTTAFSETEDEFMKDTGILLENVWDWLAGQKLLIEGGRTVYVQMEGVEAEIEPENRVVCMKFDLRRPHHTYVAVPPTATEDEAIQIAKTALKKLTRRNFKRYVLCDYEELDPYIDDEDFVCMEIDPCFNLQNGIVTTDPVGTLSK